MKDKNALPSYTEIPTNISTEFNTKIQRYERPTQEYLDSMGLAQRWRYFKEGNKKKTNDEKKITKNEIIYLKKTV